MFILGQSCFFWISASANSLESLQLSEGILPCHWFHKKKSTNIHFLAPLIILFTRLHSPKRVLHSTLRHIYTLKHCSCHASVLLDILEPQETTQRVIYYLVEWHIAHMRHNYFKWSLSRAWLPFCWWEYGFTKNSRCPYLFLFIHSNSYYETWRAINVAQHSMLAL